MSFLFYDLHCPEPNEITLLSKLVVYEFEHETKQGGRYVIGIPFCQPGYM